MGRMGEIVKLLLGLSPVVQSRLVIYRRYQPVLIYDIPLRPLGYELSTKRLGLSEDISQLKDWVLSV